MEAWGYDYKTSAVWDKLAGGYGVGDYWRMEHELLLLGVRPKSQTHSDDDTMSSMIREKRTRQHSVKPPIVHEMYSARSVDHTWNSLVGSACPAGPCLGISLHRTTMIPN